MSLKAARRLYQGLRAERYKIECVRSPTVFSTDIAVQFKRDHVYVGRLNDFELLVLDDVDASLHRWVRAQSRIERTRLLRWSGMA